MYYLRKIWNPQIHTVSKPSLKYLHFIRILHFLRRWLLLFFKAETFYYILNIFIFIKAVSTKLCTSDLWGILQLNDTKSSRSLPSRSSLRACRSPSQLTLTQYARSCNGCSCFLTPCPVVAHIPWSGLATWFASTNGTSVVCVMEAFIVITRFQSASVLLCCLLWKALSGHIKAYVLSAWIPESEDPCCGDPPNLQPDTPVLVFNSVKF